MIKEPDQQCRFSSHNDTSLSADTGIQILGKIGKGAFISLSGNLFRLIFNIVFFALITRYITQKEFGFLSLSLAFINVFTVISCLGLNKIIPGYIAENMEKNDLSRITGGIFFSYRITLLFSMAISVCLFYFSQPLAEILNKPEFAIILKQMSLIIPFATSMNMMISYLQSFHNVWGMHFRESIQSFIRVVLIAFFILLNLPFNYIIWGYILSVILSALALALYTRNRIPRKITVVPNTLIIKELLKDSYPLLFMGLIEMSMLWSGILFLGFYVSSDKVGIFNAGMRLSMLLRLLYLSTSFIFIPVASQLYYKNKLSEVKTLYASCTKMLIALTFPFFFVFFLLPNESMRFFFGLKYLQGNDFFRILSLGFMIHVLVGLSEVLLIAIRKTQQILFCSAVSITCNLLLNYILIPQWGILGASVSLCITVAINNIMTSFYIYQVAGIHPFTMNYYKLLMTSTGVLLILFLIQQTNLIHLSSFSILLFAIITVPLILILTKSYDAGDLILLTIIEKKITKQTIWSDRLTRKMESSNE